MGINDQNQVVGQVFGTAGTQLVIRQYTITPTTPPALHNPATDRRYFSPDPINRSITPTAIDQSGLVVGYYTPASVSQPFRLLPGTPTESSNVVDIPGPFPGTSKHSRRPAASTTVARSSAQPETLGPARCAGTPPPASRPF